MEARGRGKELKHRRKTPDREVRGAALRKLGFASYRLYLESPLWKEIRARVLDRDRCWCRVCKSARATQVHHLRYTLQVLRGNAGQLRFLISVCRGCHRAVEFDGGRKRDPFEVRREVITRQRSSE